MVAASALAPMLLAGCATQPAYERPALATASAWDNDVRSVPAADTADLAEEAWWKSLGDPAIDTLVEAALVDNPTLGQAIARMDQARAAAGVSDAQRLPQISLNGSVTRARTGGTQAGSGTLTTTQSSATLGPGLSWELDLWGRLKETARAAEGRLDARTADAAQARLSLTGQIADAVLRLRACHFSLTVRERDIAARELELAVMRERLSHGNVAPVEPANAASNLAAARTDRISRQEACARIVNELVALGGRDASVVRTLVTPSPGGTALPPASLDRRSPLAPIAHVDADMIIPDPPPIALALPAATLLDHPAVVAAEREAAARWAEIGVARADRLPRVDLVGLLTGNWIRMLGSTSSFDTWSAGAELSAPLFDGGAGAANIRGAQARYREAVEALRDAVRTAARDVEDALAGQQSAQQRIATSREAVEAARVVLRANEARWRAGAISMFELEDSRRQFNAAQESAIAAARDRAQAWVALVRAAGGRVSMPAEAPTGSDIMNSHPDQGNAQQQ
ncbi:outer membrane protein TolC [Sphingopyxis panaciterrae]|uniref:TolC family protein n=1 Tax=Sphingopyxis panaciterrae TaxID=363841 RepID=UPI001ABB4B8E|nr:TolC family protein [Sphingopyxis panaciterrae]NIJ37462.1 outer membrane protein TolC [Sphingopyxis panaciterrae]